MPRATVASVPRRPRPRGGFTLVELLVAIGLLLVLMTLAILIIPSINNAQQATQAGTQLQQWLEIAKQSAMRDRAPRGIRLLPGKGTSATVQVTDLEFLEQPPDLYLGSVTTGGKTYHSYATVPPPG